MNDKSNLAHTAHHIRKVECTVLRGKNPTSFKQQTIIEGISANAVYWAIGVKLTQGTCEGTCRWNTLLLLNKLYTTPH